MRLQLIIAAALICGLAGAARAQTSFGSKVQVYVDDDHTTVVSPIVDAAADVGDSTTVNAGYVADVVTSASIDVVSEASKRTIHDTRHQGTLGAGHTWGMSTVHAGYVFSTENDYRSHVLSGSLEQNFNEKNTTLDIGYALSLNTVGRSGDMNFSKPLTVHDGTISLTQVINRKAIAQASYELSYSDGFQASPYRFVPVIPMPGGPVLQSVPETDPETRWRHAWVIGINDFVGTDSSVQADYRLYTDTWGITSHTIGLRYYTNLTPKVELRLRSRFYTQNGASFYKSRYAAPQTYMAIDRELSPLWSETIGGKLMVALTSRLEGEAKLDAFYYNYADFPLLPQRFGANIGLGLSLAY